MQQRCIHHRTGETWQCRDSPSYLLPMPSAELLREKNRERGAIAGLLHFHRPGRNDQQHAADGTG